MATQKVEFDVLANDKASAKLDRIARAFKNVGDEADGVDKTDALSKLSDRLRKVADEFDKEGGKSGKSFGSSLKKWFTGDGKGLFNEIGKSGGSVFGSGFLGMLKTPVLGPALVAALAATAAVAMPAVGAVAGAGLVAGFGAGIAGLGIVFAAKSDAVKSAWKSTLSSLGADMQLLSKPFEATLIDIAGFFKRTVDAFNPALASAFSKMAGPITTFVDEASTALEQLIPAIDPITEAFNGVLGALGPALQTAVGDIAAGMTDLANSVAKNPQALADLVTGLGSITKVTLDLLTTLNDVNSGFSTLTGGVSLVDVVLGGLAAVIGTVTAPFSALSKVIEGANALLGKTGKDVGDAGASMLDAANKTTALAQGLNSTGTAAQHAGPAVLTAAQKIDAAKKAAADAKAKFEDFISSMFRLQNLSLGLSGAQINLQAAIDAASASIASNGKTLDINTEKGRSNRSALDNIASSANAQTEAMLRSGKGTASAASAAEKSRANFVTLAQKMGLSKTQAEALAKSMIAIPNVTRTAKLEAQKKDLDTKLAAARKALADPDLTKERRAQLNAEISRLLAAKKKAQDAINSLTGKTVSVTINTYKNLIETKIPGGVGVKLPGRASGGPVKKGQPYIVGENGPEVLVPDGSGTVIPNGATARGTASAGGTVINLYVSGALDKVAVAQQIHTMLKNLKRTGGFDLGLA